jgi:hypothetical protein
MPMIAPWWQAGMELQNPPAKHLAEQSALNFALQQMLNLP